MPQFNSSQISLSYPKPRSLQTKVIPILRTDNATLKAWMPKNACIVGVHVYQATAAVTNAATWTLGWAGTPGAILNAFSAGTSSVGLTNPGAAAGSGVFAPLDADRAIIATFGGTSTAGGTGFVTIDYFIPGPGEGVVD